MSMFKDFSYTNILKAALLVLFMISSLVMGGTRVEAASSSWSYYGSGLGDGVNFTASTNSNTYAPGATISVSLSAAYFPPAGYYGSDWPCDYSGNSYGPRPYSIYCPYTQNGTSGYATPQVGVAANLQSQAQIGLGNCVHYDLASCSGTFIAPTTPGTYAISLGGCGDGGCSNSSMTVNVACPSGSTWNGSACVAPPPTVSISQSASQTTSNGSQALGGQAFTVSWTVSGGSATSCTVNHQTPDGTWTNGWGTSAGTSASQSASPGWVGTHQWSVSCTGPGGTSNTSSLSHAVVCPSGTSWNGSACVAPPPTATLTANGSTNTTVSVGSPLNWAWNSTGGTSWSSHFSFSGTCKDAGLSGPWGATSASGSSSGAPISDYAGCTATVTYTVSNSSGSVTATAYVTVPAISPTGSLTVSPTSCTIASGASTCTSVASWTTNNATAPLLKDMNTGAWLSTASASSGLTVWVAYPQTVFNLQEQSGSRIYDTKTVTASCVSGTSWNGSSCAPPAASCSATTFGSCNLSSAPSGSSSGSCSSGYTGSCSYTCSNGTWYVNSNSCAAPANCTTPWGNTIASGVSVLAFSTPSVVSPAACPASENRLCTNGTLSGSYQYQNCTVLTPTATISASPIRVQSGKTTTVTWSSTDTTSCSVSGPSLSASGTSGSRTVTVTSQSTYTVSCNSGAATATATVNVVPTFQEF